MSRHYYRHNYQLTNLLNCTHRGYTDLFNLKSISNQTELNYDVSVAQAMVRETCRYPRTVTGTDEKLRKKWTANIFINSKQIKEYSSFPTMDLENPIKNRVENQFEKNSGWNWQDTGPEMPGRDKFGLSNAVIYKQNQKDFTLLVVLRSSGLSTADKIVTSYKMTNINELTLTALSAIRTHHIHRHTSSCCNKSCHEECHPACSTSMYQ